MLSQRAPKHTTNTPFITKAFLILLISASFCKKSEFSGKNSTFIQSNILRPVLEIFSSLLYGGTETFC